MKCEVTIAGGRETIRRNLPVILAEFNRERMAINGFTMDESWTFLKSCGYRCYRLHEGRLELLDDPGTVQDLYFVPEAIGDPNRALR